jgi:hypothetical protein
MFHREISSETEMLGERGDCPLDGRDQHLAIRKMVEQHNPPSKPAPTAIIASCF